MSEMETQDVEVKPPVEKRARFSKNKKKNWGKFDQTEIDEALEDKRRNEVLHGASDMTEVKDEDLFVIDRGNKKKEPKKVMTRTQRLLENKSKVPAPLPIEDQPLPNRAKYLMEKKENRKNRTLDLRKQAALKKKTSKQHETERTSLNNTYDLWGSGPQNIPGHSGSNVDSNKNFRAADHSKEMDGRSRVKRPERMKYKPDRALKIDSVVPAHGGASYNPDYDAHQHLLQQEELEKKRQYRKEKAENKMPRLSNLKWDENKVAQDLKLTDELTSTLRELVPEGSVMTERYQSFVNRAMIEPRQKHKNKKKFKVKYQEKRQYREFAEKFGKELAKE